MKTNKRINVSALKKRLEKKYGQYELFGFLLPYFESARDAAGKIAYPELYSELEQNAVPLYCTDKEEIASALNKDSYSYSELKYFYSYCTLIAFELLDRSADNDSALAKTAEYFKNLYAIDPNDLYPLLSEAERYLCKSPYFYGASDNTKNEIRRRVISVSKKKAQPEYKVAEHFITHDPFGDKGSLYSKLYFPVLTALTLGIAFLSYLVCRSIPIVLLLLLPLSESSKQICDFLFSFIVKTVPIPRKKLDKIPREGRVLSVITCLLTGKESDTELVGKLRDCAFANMDENAYFGIMCDLKESSTKTHPADTIAEERVKNAIDELNTKYNLNLYFFLRSRKYAPSEGKYMGWERKRGAIIELCRFLNGKESSVRVLTGDPDKLNDIYYVVTLDSDTRLHTGALKELVGAMLHPSNKPVLKNGRVYKGYAVLQPRMQASLSSAERTPFTLLSAGNGGTDIYASACYETYQSIFREGIFCGKGIFDLSVFSLLIDGAFPEGEVLSHDLLEGSYLRAGALSDTVLNDDLPKSPLSCFERSHRWLRGDIQALPFAFKYHMNEKREYVKSPLSSLSRFKIFDNVRRGLVPVFASLVLLLSIFRPIHITPFISVFAVSYLLLPFVFSLFSLFKSSGRRFFSFLLPEIISSAENLIYSLMSLLHTAINNIDAILRASYRMLFSGKNLLQWKTASESDGLKGLPLYIYKMLPSFLIGIALAIFCPKPFFRILGILFALFPFLSYLMSRDKKKKSKALSKQTKSVLTEYSRDIFRFFEENVGKDGNYLPPDNIIISPEQKTAYRTSPTNIGMYLLSVMAGYKLGFMTLNDALHKIKDTLNTLKKLPRWNGHLYNWYDTQKLMILGEPYISSVDSGNFVTALVALRACISNEELPPYFSSLPDDISVFIDEADFSLLYDSKKKLFKIGINTETGRGEGCYDFFASEARTTSFYAVASHQVDREHWSALSRPLTTNDGYLGMLSWTGTAFEYLMPALLLPTVGMSLSYEALYYAVREQKRASVKGVWGMSESGYFNFDSELNYQYKAFGVPSLALKRGMEKELVVSPYSVFLSLPFSLDSALSNLKRLRNKGMYGIYGFYEAIDFTPFRVGKGNAIVRSYMSHHMGMSLISACNILLDNYFINMFMSDPRCSSGKALLEERVPMNANLHRLKKAKPQITQNRTHNRYVPTVFSHQEEKNGEANVSLLSENGVRAVFYREKLSLYLSKEQIFLDPFVFGDIYRPRLLLNIDGLTYDALSGREKGSCEDSKMTFRISKRNTEIVSSVSVLGKYSSLVISVSAKGNFTDICPMLCFVPALCTVKDKISHPPYCSIMIQSYFDHGSGVLIFKKKHKGQGEICIGVSLESGGKFSFISHRDILGAQYTEKDVEDLIEKEFDNECGAFPDPFCAVKKHSKANGKYLCNFIITAGESISDVIKKVTEARAALLKGNGVSYADKAEKIYRKALNERLSFVSDDRYFSVLIKNILISLYSKNTAPVTLSSSVPYSINELWKYGISGDNKIITVILSDKGKISSQAYLMLKTVFRIHKYLSFSSVKVDTVIMYEDGGEYFSPEKDAIIKTAEEIGGGFFLKSNGGIYTVSTLEKAELFKSISVFSLELNSSFTFDKIKLRKEEDHTIDTVPIRQIFSPPKREGDGIKTSVGVFTDQGFTVYKEKKPRACPPYSYVYAKNHFGTLVTDFSLGYTWIGNSHERRISEYFPDTLLDLSGETLTANVGRRSYDLIACSHTVHFERGGARWQGEIEGISYTVTASVDPRLPFKSVSIVSDSPLDISYDVNAVMGESLSYVNRIIKTDMTSEFEKEDFVKEITAFTPVFKYGSSYDTGFLIRCDFENCVCFALGAYPNGNLRVLKYILRCLKNEDSFFNTKRKYENAIKRLLPKIKTDINDPYLSVMTDYYLPYQALVIRFFGRTGFYQSGGAYGFRDQLQDSLSVMLGAPHLTRSHILRCACRQYEEGDVNHWWHIVRGEIKGVRTRYSDDLLFLPYVVTKYVSFTGDFDILDIKLPYITSPVLSENEADRYEKPQRSEYKESLFRHCVRAIEHSLDFGKTGLPKMNGGDWNDGMNTVRGESVWLGFFLSQVLRGFAPLCVKIGDIGLGEKYRRLSDEILTKCECHYEDGHYKRAYFSDGSHVGGNEFFDILPQAFSVFAKADKNRSKTALNFAFSFLFDRENNVFPLLSPPFDRPCEMDAGYISSYPAGVRENGGQYTHAALWCAMAMLESDLNGMGHYVLSRLNPASINESEIGANKYLGEPYFCAGDVSTADAVSGRCGWSLYTGSGAWYFISVFACLLGIRIEGDGFSVFPSFSPSFSSYSLTFEHLDTVYRINARAGTKTEYILDGKKVSNFFPFDKNSHNLEITVEISEQV